VEDEWDHVEQKGCASEVVPGCLVLALVICAAIWGILFEVVRHLWE